MNITEKRTKLAELSARANAIHANAEREARNITNEERADFEAIMNEFSGMKSELEGEERRAAFMASSREYLAGIQNQPTPQAVNSQESEDEEARNRTLSGYFTALRNQKWPREYRDQSMGSPTGGGYLVPEVYMPGLMSIAAEGQIVRPRATIIEPGSVPDAKINIPVLNQGANGEFAGLSVTWVSEGGTKTETSAVLTELELEPKEVCASINITDKLLRNAPQSGQIFENLLRGRLAREMDKAFISGNGVGQPLGFSQCAAHIDITRTAASSIGFADVRNMMARLMASSWGNSVWIANQSTLPQLLSIADAAGNSIYIQGDITKKIPASLMGLPVIFSGLNSVLGSATDLMLADLSYYLIKDGSGPFVASSPHVYFTTNVTVVKIFGNVDGDSWVSAPLLLEDGSTTVSPFIVLN